MRMGSDLGKCDVDQEGNGIEQVMGSMKEGCDWSRSGGYDGDGSSRDGLRWEGPEWKG